MEVSGSPSFPTPFVGRHDELAQIGRLLTNPACRLLTLHGPGGIGKTRLALEAARQQKAFFHDGMYFVALQPLTSPDLLIPAIADSIDLQFYPGGEPKEQLLNYFHEKQLLLVLDNFEHLLDAAELISELLAYASGLKVLATSRERLNLVEEWVLDIDGLSVPAGDVEGEIDNYEAVQLFVQSAQRIHVGFTVTEAQKQAIARICQLVGGMPLGIELAAAWVRALSCQEIATEIEQSIDILATPARNIPARHRNMRAALEHSWKLLPPVEQNVFKRLSIFRGGFTREAAYAVTGASIWVLTSLVDKSLLRVDANGRYHLQELLRQYAEEQLEASGESDITRSAHRAYYADFLNQRWEPLKTHQQRQILNEIDAEAENIRFAWQTMCKQRDVSALYKSIKSFWMGNDLRCRFHEMIACFGEAADALRPIAGTPEVDRTLGLLIALQGWTHVGLGIPAKGITLAKEGLDRLHGVGTAEDVLLAMFSVQLTTNYLHLPIAYRRISNQAVEFARHSGNQWGLARAMYELANFTLGYGDCPGVSEARRQQLAETAKRTGEECLALAEQSGDLWLRASISGFLLGNVNQVLGDYTEAKRRYEQSIPLFEAVGQSWAIGAIHRILGTTFACLKDYPGAFQHYITSIQIFTDNGQVHEQLWGLYYLSELLVQWGEKDRPVKLLTLIARHPGSLNMARSRAEQLLIQLQAELPSQQYNAAVASAKAVDLETAIMELLADSHKTDAHQLEKDQPLHDALTEREIEILSLMAAGMTNREIADKLILSIGTVKWYSSQILSKLHAENRIQALTRARELKIVH